METPNVPRSIAVVVEGGLATLAELDSVYGLEDLHDLIEIQSVNNYNRRPRED